MAALMDKLGAVKLFLHSNFRMKDLGEVKFLLGMEIRKLRDGNIQIVRHTSLVLGLLPIVTSAPLVSVPNPHLCALRLEFSCSSIVCALVIFLFSH